MPRSPGCGCKPPDDPKRRRWHVRIDGGYKRVGQKHLKGAKIDADLDVHWALATPKITSAVLWQETALVGELAWQVFVNNVIKAPFGKRLLLGANPPFEAIA